MNKKNDKNEDFGEISMMIQFNNQGAFLIECGHYKKAIECLHNGNQMLVKAMEKIHQEQEMAKTTRNGTSSTANDPDSTAKQSRPILTFDCTGNSKRYRPHILKDHLHYNHDSDEEDGSWNTPYPEYSSSVINETTTGRPLEPSTSAKNNRRRQQQRRNHYHRDHHHHHHHHHHARRSDTSVVVPSSASVRPTATQNRARRYPCGSITSATAGTGTVPCTRMEHKEKEEESFVSRRPIRVSCLPPERGDYCLSVIFLFNLALAHQLLARSFSSSSSSSSSSSKLPTTTTTTTTPPRTTTTTTTTPRTTPTNTDNTKTRIMHMTSRRERYVRDSLFFYQCAFTMKNKGNLHFDTSFALGMVNNTANVLLELGYKERAQKLQQLLLTTLMMVVVVENHTKIDDMEGFLATATQSIVSSTKEPTTAMMA